MRHWLQLSTRNWRVKPGRAVASTVAIALGVGTVVSITCFYESVRRSIHEQVVTRWLGRSHLSVEPADAHWGHLQQSLAATIAEVDHVAHVNCRLKRRVYFLPPADAERSADPVNLRTLKGEELDAIGIDPATEYVFHDYADLVGRTIKPGERDVAIVEAEWASRHGLGLNDTFELSTGIGGAERKFKIVGLFTTKRVAKFQRPNVIVPLLDLQQLKNEPGEVTVIDVMLRDASVPGVKAATRAVRDRLATMGEKDTVVTSAAARLEQLQEAERITHLVLLLVAFVAMLTAFFIILTTMSMGIVERIGQLGMMRCVGMTRRQLAGLVMLEVLPLGLIGIVLGLPVGVAMTRIGAALIPEYVQGVVISRFGVGLAIVGGVVTTLASAVFLVFQVGRVSPLSAANPEARPTRLRYTLLAAGIGLALLAIHNWIVTDAPPEAWLGRFGIPFLSVVSIYGGYVLLAPALVMALGALVVAGIAPLLRLRQRLARDQITRAPWRSAGVCWMLMVGLSLIVYIGVRSESLIAAWDFPKKLPETFVWSWSRFPASSRAAVEHLPGVGELTVVTDFPCLLGTGDEVTSFVEGMKRGVTVLRDGTFVAGELDRFLEMAKISFIEGNAAEAIAKLRRGGYIIIPPEAAYTLSLGVGDKVRISVGQRAATFEVAGVVQSPALDIAVTYFQADSYMMRAASASVLGTLEDARRYFNIDEIGMYMLNIDLPPAPRPAEFDADAPPAVTFQTLCNLAIAWRGDLPNERAVLDRVVPQIEKRLEDPTAPLDREARDTLRRVGLVLQEIEGDWKDLSPDHRWELFRERLVLRKVAYAAGRPDAWVGSVRRLKQQIDDDVREVCLLMSAMPAVTLAVAALGIANLMMVSVSTRTRQIAVLRAVGATKSQIVRLIMAEALTLGVLGCLAGVVLGLHASRSANLVTAKIVGLDLASSVPWGQVGLGVALTIGVCILAGIGPARHAARNNIVDAMRAM